MKRFSRIIILCVVLINVIGNAQCQLNKGIISPNIKTIKNRLYNEYLKEATPFISQPQTFAITNGKYSDIDYTDTSAASWKPVNHLNRLQALAILYNTQSKVKYYKNKQVLNFIQSGLQTWNELKPESNGWWFNDIGLKLPLGKILILMENDLKGTPAFNDALTELGRKPSSHADQSGMNLVWLSQQELTAGLLNNNSSQIRESIDKIQSIIMLSNKEGIQYDYSFHQHGPQLYSTGYGLEFLNVTTFYAVLVENTDYAFERQKIKILSDLLLKGLRYFVRGNVFDYNASGRTFTRYSYGQNAGLASIGILAQRLKDIDPTNTDLYSGIITGANKGNSSASFIGNKFFWTSDFMSHQRKGYYFSIKMSSDRTVGSETINGENLKGGWMPYGSNFLIKTGSEYKDVFPFWDWTKVPGVTATNKLLKTTFGRPESFQNLAAGVSDGYFGACAMTISKDSLQAKKAWFCFDDEIVALGSGITSQASENVFTCLNQVVRNGVVTYSKQKVTTDLREDSTVLTDVDWVVHDSIGYVVKGGSKIQINNKLATGNWYKINRANTSFKANSSKSLFTLSILHGSKPQNQKYQYIIIPNVSNKTVLDSYVGESVIDIVSNDDKVQGVIQKKLNVTEAVFYQPGLLKVSDQLSVAVSKPCLLLIKVLNGQMKISVSNPYYTDTDINVKISYNNKIYNSQYLFKNCKTEGITKAKVIQF